MPYVEPTNGKIKHTGRKKRLNIYNTDKYYNFSTALAKDVDSKVNVDFSTKPYIDEIMAQNSMADLYADDTRYFYEQGKMLIDDYVIDMIKSGMYVEYYVKLLVSDAVLDAMAESGRGKVIYGTFGAHKNIDRDLVNNVMKAHEATKVMFDFPGFMPDLHAETLLMYMANFRTNVDLVNIDFSPLHEDEMVDWRKPYYYLAPDGLYHPYTKEKFNFFKKIKDPLSAWGMNIVMVANSKAEQAALDDMARKDQNG
ncbi:hypothetical protein lb338_phage_148 [Lactobacillus phage Lb338-1]|uniref:Uncharacterized protein n=1 Tax=Lactobacillus phage Lb338-1 TaxID=2892342 RepID=C1KFQ8_9CAUD|nr:hypothetical protein lb338_phage_148 [Lactobacillus phage Lb338-1]ACO37069.1 hypothetical protein lb338_phage_148 [Lactobacillus phage Lb338-1]